MISFILILRESICKTLHIVHNRRGDANVLIGIL